MLRLYLLQNLYTLSDEATVAEAVDSRAFSDFCGAESSNQVPDGDTLGRFRHILEKNNLQKKLFTQVIGLLQQKDLLLEKGTIADPQSLPHHPVKVTGANVHDVTMTPELLTGDEESVYGDSGYLGAEARDCAIIRNKNGKKIKYRINRRPSQLKKLSVSGQYAAKKVEHRKSSVRAKVEHVFGAVKDLFGYRKTRCRGLMKQTAKLNMMFALANLYLAA
mgnify:CR=1 FL=1